MTIMFVCLAVFLILGVLILSARDIMCSGRFRSMNDNRLYGKYRVRYENGKVSQPFFKDVAEDYAKMFKGTVEKFR